MKWKGGAISAWTVGETIPHSCCMVLDTVFHLSKEDEKIFLTWQQKWEKWPFNVSLWNQQLNWKIKPYTYISIDDNRPNNNWSSISTPQLCSNDSVNPPPSGLVALFNKIFILSRFEPLMAEEDCDSIATLENFHFRFPRKYSSRTSTAAGLWFYRRSLEKNLRLAPFSNSRLLPQQQESQHYDCIFIFLLALKNLCGHFSSWVNQILLHLVIGVLNILWKHW